jgi:hypothetical protein
MRGSQLNLPGEELEKVFYSRIVFVFATPLPATPIMVFCGISFCPVMLSDHVRARGGSVPRLTPGGNWYWNRVTPRGERDTRTVQRVVPRAQSRAPHYKITFVHTTPSTYES